MLSPAAASGPSAPRFVSFEGIDGAGKSTLISAVSALLRDRGEAVHITREETTGWLGDSVKRSIQDRAGPYTTLFLFLADRAEHLRGLAPHFEADRLVLTDRYHDSTRAYQAVTLAKRFGAGETGVASFEGWLADVSSPWLVPTRRTYLLDIDPQVSVERMSARASTTPYEKQRFLEAVRDQYHRLAEMEPERFRVLDATQKVSTLAREVVLDLETVKLVRPREEAGV